MANSVDPDQTAPIGAVCYGSTLFASILNLSVMLQLLAADNFSIQHFQMHFFLGALRAKITQHAKSYYIIEFLLIFSGISQLEDEASY